MTKIEEIINLLDNIRFAGHDLNDEIKVVELLDQLKPIAELGELFGSHLAVEEQGHRIYLDGRIFAGGNIEKIYKLVTEKLITEKPITEEYNKQHFPVRIEVGGEVYEGHANPEAHLEIRGAKQ